MRGKIGHTSRSVWRSVWPKAVWKLVRVPERGQCISAIFTINFHYACITRYRTSDPAFACVIRPDKRRRLPRRTPYFCFDLRPPSSRHGVHHCLQPDRFKTHTANKFWRIHPLDVSNQPDKPLFSHNTDLSVVN